jgi:hemerythrin-like domain-containing protein
MNTSRRHFLIGVGTTGAAIALAGCGRKESPQSGEPEVTATEDLMREHGVLRRVLFVYSEAAARLKSTPEANVAEGLRRAATLFRDFGEEYHEKKLEEAHIFPAVKKAGGEAAGYVDTLISQHARGREMTDYILTRTSEAKMEGSLAPLVMALEAMVRMYRPHAAREDTVVFPAWKLCLSAVQMDEMNDKFEDIEHAQFGEGGFQKAVKEIAAVETMLGLADLSQFTAGAAPANDAVVE